MPKITRIPAPMPEPKKKKRVAAYARVSFDNQRLLHSLSAQVSYYSEYIQANPEWEYAGVYADEAITGTVVRKRDEFKRIIADCEAGKIDIVLTKSISRFARNTVDLLETVRHLKDIGVEVWFEKENIRTMSGDGELMLSILASFAQEEVRSLSDNVRWARKKKIEAGEAPVRFAVTGYRWEGDKLVIHPEEAELVRCIFREFIDGKPIEWLCDELNAEGLTTRRGVAINRSGVAYILKNPLYKGDLLLQKTYRDDPIAKTTRKNMGELPMVLVENDHKPIIDAETFEQAQREIERRRELYNDYIYDFKGMRPFTYKVKCPRSDETYRHGQKDLSYGGDGAWVCFKFDCPYNDGTCDHKCVPDLAIRQACKRALKGKGADDRTLKEMVDEVIVPEDGRLTIKFTDGTVYEDFYRGLNVHVPPQGRNDNVFTRKIRCGVCGRFYRAMPCKRKGIRRVEWGCFKGKDNSYIHESVLKHRVAEAAGWDEFTFERFKDEVEMIDMDRPCHMVIRFKDGHTAEAEYYAWDRRGGNAKKSNDDSRN